jgi:1,4-alpha-glucan branching enzyme
MATVSVRFVYYTGLTGDRFKNPRLFGSWNQWKPIPMQVIQSEDGCPAFSATVDFDSSQVGQAFHWGVRMDTPAAADIWAIPTEIPSDQSTDRDRSFSLLPANAAAPQEERYYLTHSRRMGAQKVYTERNSPPAIRFSVWAPNARTVDVVFGSWQSGYIYNDGKGMDPAVKTVSLRKAASNGNAAWNGIWQSDPQQSPQLADFAKFDHFPYMYRVTREDGSIAFRTDLHSRCQIGSGGDDPADPAIVYNNDIKRLDGAVSCSAVVDADTVTKVSKPAEWPGDRDNHLFIPQDQFWQNEFDPAHPLPARLEDLVIYELHVASLGYGRKDPGTFDDAIKLLDSYIVPLGVNAIELLPVAEFGGHNEWGYGDTHHFALEFRSGGRDQFKHFVRECHRRGIAVILDVVYNHFAPNAERSEYAYDATAPNNDIYYWYEGRPNDYPTADGGYLDNGSTGRTPRLWEETVRKYFISSAATLITEFHVDGFRVDLTQALHQDNRRHSDGALVGSANAFGAKLLREWSRTLKMIRPNAFLIAEDHTKKAFVTQPPDLGGLGFDATWYVDFYHHLVGTVGEGDVWAKMIALAGLGGDNPLSLDWFCGVLLGSVGSKVVYHISHDEAGNSGKDDPNPNKHSHRTIVQAVHGAPLIGATRDFAESRSRFAFGMSMLSPGTPMFLFGEEVGAVNDYVYNDYVDHREDLAGMRTGIGARLFQFYQEIIAFRRLHRALRYGSIDCLYNHCANRVLVFRRCNSDEDLLIFASLNNRPFNNGYWIYTPRLPDASWREVFNSDAAVYGGNNVGNAGGTTVSRDGNISVVIPANGFVILQRT